MNTVSWTSADPHTDVLLCVFWVFRQPREIGRLLSDSQPCPHCHLPVEIRTVVPMQRPCPHCTKPVVFSWCQRKLRDSRNHCLVCIGCSEVNFQHCLVREKPVLRPGDRAPGDYLSQGRRGGAKGRATGAMIPFWAVWLTLDLVYFYRLSHATTVNNLSIHQVVGYGVYEYVVCHRHIDIRVCRMSMCTYVYPEYCKLAGTSSSHTPVNWKCALAPRIKCWLRAWFTGKSGT